MNTDPEKLLLKILEDGEDLEDTETQIKWTIRAIKGLALVSLDSRKDIKSIKMIIKILAYVMMPTIAALVGGIITLIH